MNRRINALLLTLWLIGGGLSVSPAELPPADWGIDGVITLFPKDDADFEGYVRLLHKSGVRWVRERGVGQDPQMLERLRAMRAAGLNIVAFAGAPGAGGPQRPGNSLTEDLLAIYQGAFRQGRDFAGLVSAWELPGEPDIGYCPDLPERLAAFNKAMYLGLHDGAAAAGEPVIVLMGALGMPPGPWLERAAVNGVFDYTDAANIHFYGDPSDLTGVIEAHREFLRTQVGLADRVHWAARPLGFGERGWRPSRTGANGGGHLAVRRPALPIWITECGLSAVPKNDYLNPERRERQAAFTRETALRAWREPDVAMFMPFILVHAGDGHAMTLSATEPLPAWSAYEQVSRDLSWPDRPLAQPVRAPSRLVLQWLPLAGQGRTHKVAGTYRFVGDETIIGEVRIYNFDSVERRGRLSWSELTLVGVELSAPGEIVVPPMGMVSVPVVFTPKTGGYFREQWRAEFVPTGGEAGTWPVVFGLERLPRAEDFVIKPLKVAPAPKKNWPKLWSDSVVTDEEGPWHGIDGVQILKASSDHAEGSFWVPETQVDPLRPPMAVVRLAGLPADGFLRVRSDQPLTPGRRVRVDLIDDRGQRFTIWEKGGADYHDPGRDLWLSLQDFHLFFWGHATKHPDFDPARIVELQLRIYLSDPDETMKVWVETAQAK